MTSNNTKDFKSEFKASMLKGMQLNFEKDGYLAPIAFFLHQSPIEGNPPVPTIIPIDGNLLSDYETKSRLSFAMHSMCKNPMIIAAGLILEANCAKFDNNDELGKLVASGAIRVSELKDKNDVILMIFSTPVNEEMFMYNVDVKNKTVGERYPESNQFTGLFTNFFGWNKN
jgi:hypothetical protein